MTPPEARELGQSWDTGSTVTETHKPVWHAPAGRAVHTCKRAAGSRARTSPTLLPCALEDQLRQICSVTEADEAPAKGAKVEMKGKVSDRST